MPPTGGPTGVPGCCECVTAAPPNLTVTVLGCNGLGEAGATVTVVNAAAGVNLTGTTDASGNALFSVPNIGNNYTVTATTAKYTRSTSTFGSNLVTITHPGCNCFTGWGTSLTLTDPWGPVTLTRSTINSTTWGGSRYVTCQGIAHPSDVGIGGCENAILSQIGVLISHGMSCVSSGSSFSLIFSSRWEACGASGSTGVGGVISERPIPFYNEDGTVNAEWNLAGGYHEESPGSDPIDVCTLDCRQPPNLTFSGPGLNYSGVGGPGSFSPKVTL